MDEPLRFDLTVDQNPHLPAGGDQMHAIVTVTATDPTPGAAPTGGAPAAEVIIIDRSGSMSGSKLTEACAAAATAVETLPDGARFAVIAGDGQVTHVYPGDGRLATASAATRKEAVAATKRVGIGGTTCIGVWLRAAADLLRDQSHAVRHAILLTDGQSATITEADFAYCAGVFTCDSLGVGEDWNPDQLAQIAQALSGTRDYVRDPTDLAAYFAALTRQATARSVPELTLRVLLPRVARVIALRQVHPTVRDLTGAPVSAGGRAVDYATGSWAAEEREYHLQLGFPAGQPGEEIRAAALRLVAPATGADLARGNVLAVWTDDLRQATRANPKVAHFTGQLEVNDRVQEGLRALDAGDQQTATAKLGEARRLAARAGHADTIRLLDRLVEVDARTGTAKLRKRVARSDRLALDIGTDKTVKLAPDQPGAGSARRPAAPPEDRS